MEKYLTVPMIIIIHCCDEEEQHEHIEVDKHPSPSLLSPPVSGYQHLENPWTFFNKTPYLEE